MPEESSNNGGDNNKSSRNKNKRRRPRKRGGRNNRRRNKGPKKERPIEELEAEYVKRIKEDDSIEKPECPLCNEPIYIMSQSITHRGSSKPAHFDCVLKEIEAAHKLDEKDKIVYLGGGSFGIVQDRKAGRKKINFFVRERIQYEEKKDKHAEQPVENEQ